MVRWATPFYKKIKMSIGGFPNSVLILSGPGDINTSLYQALLLTILNHFPSKRLPAYLYLLFS